MATPAAPPSWWYREPPSLVRPILQRLRQPHRAHVLLAREVGDGARHPQRSMDTARAHAAAIDRIADQSPGGDVEQAVLRERRVREPRVQRPAGALALARREHALAHRGARL